MSRPLSKEELARYPMKRSKGEWVIELLCLAAIIATIVVVAVDYGALPSTIATHFNAAGQPDGYGGKATLLLFLGLSLFLYALLTVAVKFPRFFNLPVQLTVENAARQLALVRWFIALIKLICCWMLFYLLYISIAVAQGASAGLGWGIWIFVGLLLLSIIPMFVLSYKWK